MSSQIRILGRTLAGNPLAKTVFSVEEAAEKLHKYLKDSEQIEANMRLVGTMQPAHRGQRPTDRFDPRLAGWAVVTNPSSPRYDDRLKILERLEEHRNAAGRHLLYEGQQPAAWLEDVWPSADTPEGHSPEYLLIVGDPSEIPFDFQTTLAAARVKVGRVAFDELDQLQAYVDKLLRLEKERKPEKTSALFVGPDEGYPDPTFFSFKSMIQPLSSHVEKKGFTTTVLGKDKATKKATITALADSDLGLVFTASHGTAEFDTDTDAALIGSMQFAKHGAADHETFSCYDVPNPDVPFLEGATFFQFGCFTYGVPASSKSAIWHPDVRESYTGSETLAALPKALLAHPKGPLAFIGHLDVALLNGFTDEKDPVTVGRDGHQRLRPFEHSAARLLKGVPVGVTMDTMSSRVGVYNKLVAEEMHAPTSQLVEYWIIKCDAENHMIFGDPATRIC